MNLNDLELEIHLNLRGIDENISLEELSLIESMLPDLIIAMMQHADSDEE